MNAPLDQGRAAEIAADAGELRRIQSAMQAILTGNAKRVDGDGWKVYLAGTVLRVDIEAA